jgi:hypothetical protein
LTLQIAYSVCWPKRFRRSSKAGEKKILVRQENRLAMNNFKRCGRKVMLYRQSKLLPMPQVKRDENPEYRMHANIVSDLGLTLPAKLLTDVE